MLRDFKGFSGRHRGQEAAAEEDTLGLEGRDRRPGGDGLLVFTQGNGTRATGTSHTTGKGQSPRPPPCRLQKVSSDWSPTET